METQLLTIKHTNKKTYIITFCKLKMTSYFAVCVGGKGGGGGRGDYKHHSKVADMDTEKKLKN